VSLDFRTPEELLAIGFSRSRVVMMNEAHHMMQRCVRTREIGLRILPVAHAAGARHLAIEALRSHSFSQPDMQRLVDGAKEFGWKVIPYEARRSPTDPNDREEQQARNLFEAFAALPQDSPLLVWCGWGHLYKQNLIGDLRTMASQFWELSGVEPFCIDQTVTVEAPPHPDGPWHQLARSQAWRLAALGGTAGFLVADSPIPWPYVDAVLLSTENALE
jgi:hypothetical protein